VLSNPGPYLFPAGGQAGLVNDDFLIQYLAVRGQAGEGEPFLDEESLAAVLQFYQDGTSQGIFPPEILELQSTDDSWLNYLDGNAALSHVNIHRYLMERDLALNSSIAPIPAINGPGASIGRGWAVSLVTSDPARQSLAAEFLTQLMSPETNAAWNLTSNYAPTRQAAMALWDQTDGYTRFLKQLLTAAQRRPALPNYTQVAAALQEAVEDVLSGTSSPEEAAALAVEKVQ
jgi:multiple sugar transport system substrate-binding protein